MNKSFRLVGMGGVGREGPTLYLWLREGLPQSIRSGTRATIKGPSPLPP